jgi:hypothetical protein
MKNRKEQQQEHFIQTSKISSPLATSTKILILTSNDTNKEARLVPPLILAIYY